MAAAVKGVSRYFGVFRHTDINQICAVPERATSDKGAAVGNNHGVKGRAGKGLFRIDRAAAEDVQHIAIQAVPCIRPAGEQDVGKCQRTKQLAVVRLNVNVLRPGICRAGVQRLRCT